MDSILRDINAIEGVVGTFVCDGSGTMLASALPRGPEAAAAQARAASSVAQIVSGLRNTCMAEVSDVDLHCDGGRLIVKGLNEGCLGILCAPHVNVSELNLTANVAARKLGRQIRRLATERDEKLQSSVGRRAGSEPSAGQSTESILERVLDLWR